MKFEDVLLDEMLWLPDNVEINKDIYDALTYPYQFDDATDIKTYTNMGIQTAEGVKLYELNTSFRRGDIEVDLRTNVRIEDNTATVKACCYQLSTPALGDNDRGMLFRYYVLPDGRKVEDCEMWERFHDSPQDCLRELTDALEWGNLFVNDANLKAKLRDSRFTHEQLGLAYNAIRTWYNPDDPSTALPVTIDMFGQGEDRPNMVRFTRKDAEVDGKLVDDVTCITHDASSGKLSLDYNSRPKSDKVLRELARNGQPFVTHYEEETVVNSKDTAAVVFATRELCEHNFAKLNANDLVADLDTTNSLEL